MLSSGTTTSVRDGYTMRSFETLKPVSFHNPCKSFADTMGQTSLPIYLRGSSDINVLPRDEMPGTQLRPHVQHSVLGNSELL
jgi:hypothetical protein